MLTVVLLLVEAVAIGGGFMLFLAERVEARMALDLDMPEYEVMLEEVVIFDGALETNPPEFAIHQVLVDARDRPDRSRPPDRRGPSTPSSPRSGSWPPAELESPDMAAIESRIKRSFEQSSSSTATGRRRPPHWSAGNR